MRDAYITDHALERHRRIRAGFVVKGTSFTAWCEARGVKHQNALKAVMGEWTGPKAEQLVAELLQASGVME